MSTFTVKHLVERANGRFAYRRRVPGEVQALIGKREWKHAYPKGTTLSGAQALTIKYDAEHDAELRIALSKLGKSERSEATITPEIYQAAIAYVQGQGLVGKQNLAKGKQPYEYTVAEHWAEEHTKQDWTEGSDGYEAEYVWDSPFSEAVYHVLEESKYPEDRELLIGAVYQLDLEAREIKDDKALNYAIQSFVEIIGDLDIRHITWNHASQWKKECQSKGLSPGTISRRAGALKAMIARQFRIFGVSKDNPFANLGLKKGHSSDQRLPFSLDHLEAIDSYLDKSKVDLEVRLIIEVLKATGARLSEVTGLTVNDVKPDASVPHILIRNNAIRELKTNVSERTIPINAKLKSALVKQCRGKKGSEPVFQEKNRKTNNISAKINKAIRAAGVPESPKLVGYSFRHTMKEAMRTADIPIEDQWYLLGHANPTVAARYGSPKKDLGKLKRHMDKAVRLLGDVPEGTHDDL